MNNLLTIRFLLYSLMPLAFGQDLTALRDLLKDDCKPLVEGYAQDMKQCMHNHIGVVKDLTQNLVPAVKTICKSDFGICFEEFEKKLENCAKDENNVKYFNDQEKAFNALVIYACKDDGQPLTNFILHGMKCFSEQNVTEKITSCASIAQAQHTFTNLHLDEMCRKAGNQSLCLLDAIDQCSVNAARNFIGGALHEALTKTRCKAIIEKEYPSINSGVPINLF